MAVAAPAMFAVGDIVDRLRPGNYDLSKTNKVLASEIKFKGLSHASNLESKNRGNSVIEWTDEHGALVSYDQVGYSHKGYLFYKHEDLELVKRPDGTINNYSIY